MQELLAQIAERAYDPERATDEGRGITDALGHPVLYFANPPATPEELEAASHDLPGPLPDLLARLYGSIGNGGFGPGYGLLPLPTPSIGRRTTITELLSELRSNHPEWPSSVVPVVDWGCGIYSCLDFASGEASVLRYDHHAEPETLREYFRGGYPDCHLFPECSSFERWLVGWVEGEPLFDIQPELHR